MIVTTKGFVSLIKYAYKKSGLRVWSKVVDDNPYYLISGGYWGVWTRAEFLTKECRGEIIKLCGEFPPSGTGYVANSTEVQYELDEPFEVQNFIGTFETAEEMEVTKVMLQGKEVTFRVFQSIKTNKIIIANDKFTFVTGMSDADQHGGECMVEGPKRINQSLIWKNNVSGIWVLGRIEEGFQGIVNELEKFNLEESFEENYEV